MAFVSYNTYPGWHARGIVRDLLRFQSRRESDPRARIDKARQALGVLSDAIGRSDSAYCRGLKEIVAWLGPREDWYFFHEYLEDVNEPLYFHEFVERLKGAHLKYLGETWLAPATQGFSPQVETSLRTITADSLELEQYADLLANRTFRRSIVAHEDVVAAPRRSRRRSRVCTSPR